MAHPDEHFQLPGGPQSSTLTPDLARSTFTQDLIGHQSTTCSLCMPHDPDTHHGGMPSSLTHRKPIEAPDPEALS